MIQHHAASNEPAGGNRMTTQFVKVIDDLAESCLKWRFWVHLSWEDIARQYRRSFLGPIWITLNTTLFIIVFGLIGAQLFNTPATHYLPYLCVGHILFSFLSLAANEGCQAFMQAEPFLKQAPFPKFAFVFRVVWRNLLMLLHNVPVMFLVLALTSGLSTIRPLWLMLGIVLLVLFTVLGVAILGLVAARFRDVPMIVSSTMQIAFFVTPVMWRPEQLTQRAQLATQLNPLAAILELVRAPLMGSQPSNEALLLALATIGCLLLVCAGLYTLARRRIAYWI
jgi:lipopolysaccharide transport system permease protein